MINIYLEYIAIVISLLPVVLCYKQRHSLIWVSAALSFVSNLLLVFIIKALTVKSAFANIYVWVDFLLLFGIYHRYGLFSFFPGLIYISVLVFIGEVVYTLFFNGQLGVLANLEKFNGTGLAYLSLLYILLSLYGYIVIIRQLKNILLERSAFFWFNTAVIIYSSGGLVIFLFIQYFSENNMSQHIAKLWPINNLLDMVRSTLFLISLRQIKKWA